MVQLQITTILLSTMFVCAPAAPAQNNISLASNISRPGAPAPATCQQAATILAQLLLEFPRPQTWHWIIVCDDAAWRQFLTQRDQSTRISATGETIYASTDLVAHLTFLRGSTLLKPDNPLATSDHVIAHELGHIMLNTPDEDRAEQQAATWQRALLQNREERSGPNATSDSATGPPR